MAHQPHERRRVTAAPCVRHAGVLCAALQRPLPPAPPLPRTPPHSCSASACAGVRWCGPGASRCAADSSGATPRRGQPERMTWPLYMRHRAATAGYQRVCGAGVGGSVVEGRGEACLVAALHRGAQRGRSGLSRVARGQGGREPRQDGIGATAWPQQCTLPARLRPSTLPPHSTHTAMPPTLKARAPRAHCCGASWICAAAHSRRKRPASWTKPSVPAGASAWRPCASLRRPGWGWGRRGAGARPSRCWGRPSGGCWCSLVPTTLGAAAASPPEPPPTKRPAALAAGSATPGAARARLDRAPAWCPVCAPPPPLKPCPPHSRKR